MIKALQEDKSKTGIWRYDKYLAPVEERFRLSLAEGRTPLVKTGNIFFKREDLNPTGSLKDRGLAYQISVAFAAEEKNLVISSSGNAAIAAAAYCQLANINLEVFVSPTISFGKLEQIKKYHSTVTFSKRPLSDSVKLAKERGFRNLRPSRDKWGSEGYKTVAYEIYQEQGRIADLFLPVSSATCLVGLTDGFEDLGFMPRIHACQSTKIFTIAKEFDKVFVKTCSSLAHALVAGVTPRKEAAIGIIKKSGGWGWVINDRQIKDAWEWLEKHQIITSAEGALALAAIWKAQSKKFKLGKTVCLLTGKKY